MEKSKDIQEPQNHDNDHDGIQDRLDGSCHGYKVIHQPEENAHYDQYHAYLNQRHDLLTSMFSEADAYTSAPRYALLSIACASLSGLQRSSPQSEWKFQALGLVSQDLAEDGIDLDFNPHRWPDPGL
jgi:hypothetical protein